MRPEYARLMTHLLTIYKRERNWEGNFVVSESFTDIPGFVEYGKHLVTGLNGEEVMATAIIFLRDDAPITPEHPHWIIEQVLPYVRENMEVVRIDPISDPRNGRTHHFEVAVK